MDQPACHAAFFCINLRGVRESTSTELRRGSEVACVSSRQAFRHLSIDQRRRRDRECVIVVSALANCFFLVFKNNNRITSPLLRAATECLQLHAVMSVKITKRLIR
jgi:hypothetical protein